MSEVFEVRALDFIEQLSSILEELSGGSDHRVECVIEAANLVAAFVDADGRHTTAELDSWVGAIGTRLTPPMIVTSGQLRRDGTFGGRVEWLSTPSTMFDLLVRADAKDSRRRANSYYTLAMALAHATAALDFMPSPNEIAAIDRFRTLLLTTMDHHGVARPGQPDVVVASQPTRGLDVAGVRAIQRLLIDQRDNGTGVLMVSEDLDELLALADRIVVMVEGCVVAEFDAREATRTEIGEAMMGAGV
jgi:hypothetical protein